MLAKILTAALGACLLSGPAHAGQTFASSRINANYNQTVRAFTARGLVPGHFCATDSCFFVTLDKRDGRDFWAVQMVEKLNGKATHILCQNTRTGRETGPFPIACEDENGNQATWDAKATVNMLSAIEQANRKH
jgi:hypothetical protein